MMVRKPLILLVMHMPFHLITTLGAKLVFAGTEKDDDNKLTVILDFESPEAMKAFAGHEELKAKRAAAGAILETTVVTPMSGESFTR
jgi:hypothetical protein